MEYIDVRRAAQLWEMSERRVTLLCRNGRIAGAKKIGKLWMLPVNAAKPLDGRTKEFASSAAKVLWQEPHTAVASVTGSAGGRVVRAFESTYRKSPEHTAFTPYRICPLGARSAHQLGKATGFALDKGVYMACGPKQNGVVEISSLQFPKRAQWHVASTPPQRQNDWADHLRGATIALNKRYPLRTGLCAIIDGELPIGGLSSSAAVVMTFLSALCHMNSIHPTADELISISQEAETQYMGVPCGKLDQYCEVYCRKDRLLYIDLLDDTYELIAPHPDVKPYKVAIFFSGVEGAHVREPFQIQVDECRAAAYALRSYEGMEARAFEQANLRGVPYEVFLQYKDRLPESWARRAEYWYGEFVRVQRGVEAWRKGDVALFGRLICESGRASLSDREIGSPELNRLFEIVTETEGVYGGRFSETGIKGSCIALIDPAYEESICETVAHQYLKDFPYLEEKYSVHICETADGVLLS